MKGARNKGSDTSKKQNPMTGLPVQGKITASSVHRQHPGGESFEESLRARFESGAKAKTLHKGEFLVKEGEIDNNLYLVESGAVRVFYLTEFEEIVIRFGYKGSMITSLSSFINHTPSEFYIDALRKTTLRQITRDDVLRIVNERPENMQAYIGLLEGLVTQQIEREIDLLIASPAERLKRVLQRSPNLFQEVPLKYIASYLRMTPETLSRIRNS